MQTSPLTSEDDVTVESISLHDPLYPGYLTWTFSEGTERYTSFDALPPYVEIRNRNTQWFIEAKANIKYITSELLSNKHKVKLSGDNSCANDMLLDGGGDVVPINAGRGILVNFENSTTVRGCITGRASYNSQVLTVGQATQRVELQANQLYEIHGNHYVPPTMKIYRISPFSVLTRTNAQTVPYSIEPETFLLFKSGYYRRAVPLLGNDPNLCSECVENVQISKKNCTNSVIVDGQNALCRNSKEGLCVILADRVCNGSETLVVDSAKAFQYARLSSRIPMHLLNSISMLLKTRLACFEFKDLQKLTHFSAQTILLTLATMRSTYELLDGANLSLLSESALFRGAGTVQDPVPFLFDTIHSMLLVHEKGLYSLTRGEFVAVCGNQIRYLTRGTTRTLIPYDGYQLWS